MSDITHRFVESNGLRLHIAEQGEGPLAVLCHGWPECWYSWRHQIPAMTRAAAGSFFYQLYFQEPGVAEAELEADVRGSLRRILYTLSGDAPGDRRWQPVHPTARTLGEPLTEDRSRPDPAGPIRERGRLGYPVVTGSTVILPIPAVPQTGRGDRTRAGEPGGGEAAGRPKAERPARRSRAPLGCERAVLRKLPGAGGAAADAPDGAPLGQALLGRLGEEVPAALDILQDPGALHAGSEPPEEILLSLAFAKRYLHKQSFGW